MRNHRVAVASALLTLALRTLGAQDGPQLDVALNDADSVRSAVVRLSGLLQDGSIIRAMESGFPLYVEFAVELKESRSLWDRTVEIRTWEYVILWDPLRERFRLEDTDGSELIGTEDRLRRRIEQMNPVVLTPDGAGEFYYAAEVQARTLDDKDVDEVFAWLKGEDVDAPSRERPGAITRAARRFLVAVAPLPSVHVKGRSRSFHVTP